MPALHGPDATAAAPRRHPLRPVAGFLVALLAASGCADPVGDPSDRFEISPAPVLGRWVERDPTADPPREAFIEAGEGVLAGRFQFERTRLPFEVTFSEATWDGSEIRFVTGDVFGSGSGAISWAARLVPATGGNPTILRLFPTVGGGVPFSVEYVRP
ncbi:MAG TPA: hypothetical protein VJP59_06335 [Gemmatimonadota bacterium]|nr:hypothetical protein [Gemmatimonadota bacterium]